LTTTFDSPLVGLLDAAIESHVVRQEWNGGLGILFPSDEDGSNSQGARIRTVWDREDEPVTQSASCQRRLLPWGLDFADTLLTITSFACRLVTAPYHTVVSRMAQRAAGLQYRYAENDAEGALFDTLSTLCAAWVTLCSYVFTPVYVLLSSSVVCAADRPGRLQPSYERARHGNAPAAYHLPQGGGRQQARPEPHPSRIGRAARDG
jgi:hypothetical protein